MELKIVYRILRKISEWTVDGYYSEVYVDGAENVPRDGPLIVTSSHHNEIIDIATLATTIPHRRRLCFWAKSTMFANPITRTILSSSGAIPVRRNPNNGNGSTSGRTDAVTNGGASQSSLFRETSAALIKGELIGVFPEGTSYTQPSIIQVMPGAAWAAVEYARHVRDRRNDGDVKGTEEFCGGKRDLVIVPVGIVYTDKSRYRSRIFVKYGKPIDVSSYTDELVESENWAVGARAVVEKLTATIEREMLALTINAPDWPTLYAAQTARDIIWGEEANLPLEDWLSVSQTLVQLFSDSPASTKYQSDRLTEAKASLNKYFALMHHTQFKHSDLEIVFPQSCPAKFLSRPQSTSTRRSLLLKLPLHLLNFALFTIPMLAHIPAYISGTLASRYLATKGEEETQAEYKAVIGGLGYGGGLSLALGLFWKKRGLEMVCAALRLEFGGGRMAGLKRVLGLLGLAYGGVWALTKWHNALIDGNYKRFRRLVTFYKLFMGIGMGRYAEPLSLTALQPYLRPPPPPANPFIRRSEAKTESPDIVKDHISPPTSIPQRMLIRPLLDARERAVTDLTEYLSVLGKNDKVEFLKAKVAREL